MKKEIPIMFSTPMVQAILAGRKTMTRRLVGLEEYNESPDDWKIVPRDSPTGFLSFKKGNTMGVEHFKTFWDDVKCPYGRPGDILWVRENFRVQEINRFFDTEWRNIVCIDFPASNGTKDCRHFIRMDEKDRSNVLRRRHPEKVFTSPSIHLPMNCSRIWLEVTDVRVERLQDITAGDACDEGIEYWNIDYAALDRGELFADFKNYTWSEKREDDPNYEDRWSPSFANAVDSFRTLWQHINGEESWKANPWVWVVEFKVVSKNGKESCPRM